MMIMIMNYKRIKNKSPMVVTKSDSHDNDVARGC